MSVVSYTPTQLQSLSIIQLERIAIELGLVGLQGRGELTSRILEWQRGINRPATREFSVGMMTGPVVEAYAELLDFYEVKKTTARILNDLSPLSFEALLQRLPVLPALPTSPHETRVAYLLMYDLIAVTTLEGTSALAFATRQLAQYFTRKDYITRYLLELTDAALFAVVDQYGSNLVITNPYVQINNVRYDDRLAVVYYLVTLSVR